MCRTTHAVIAVGMCGIQMLVRTIMTLMLMIENILRLLMQTFYNLLSFVLQLISLLPICIVFIVSSRLKCFMCGGGGPCPVNRGGGCDCLMSLMAIIILFFIFRATGVLDKLFYSIGYAKAPTYVARFIPTPGEVTECSRNDTEVTEYELDYLTTVLLADDDGKVLVSALDDLQYNDTQTEILQTEISLDTITDTARNLETEGTNENTTPHGLLRARDDGYTWPRDVDNRTRTDLNDRKDNLTTILYYFI